MTRVRLFAAAAEAAGVDAVTVGVDAEVSGDPHAQTLGRLRRELIDRYGAEFEHVLGRCAVLVDGVRLSDADPVPVDATVDVLPPFAGG